MFIDVRDPNEVNFVSHPTLIDATVPLLRAVQASVPEDGSYAIASNDTFATRVSRMAERERGMHNVNGWSMVELRWTYVTGPENAWTPPLSGSEK
ncbi:hypothetical protein [Tateyamaria pelophila]|uniref:hypothetical protein n=1 Tax=Tateyamaria pelophila TaxID=328415 RepID=UPI001CBFE7A1|nr:hypothetical protein [Tateyamaria pelophila]